MVVAKFTGCMLMSLVFSECFYVSAVVTNENLNEIKCAVFDLVDNYQSSGPQVLLAAIVRLAFHDCIGGCDGFIDMSGGSEGFDIPINNLEPIYERFSKNMSRADFWAASGTMAIFKGALNAQSDLPPLKFYSGRIDRSGTNISSPNPHGGIEEVMGFFHRYFGLTPEESVAIMGAHCLGQGHPKNTGFSGPWTDHSDHFDNSYYTELLRKQGWKIIALPSGVKQWAPVGDQNSSQMMLNVDMSLAIDIGDPNMTDGSHLKCNISTQCCTQSYPISGVNGTKTVAQLASLYANDNKAWLRTFAKAFNKLISTVPAGITLAEVQYTDDVSCCCDCPCVSDPAKTSTDGNPNRKRCSPRYLLPSIGV